MFTFFTPSIERRKQRERQSLDHQIFDAEKALTYATAQLAYLRKRRGALEQEPEFVVGSASAAGRKA